MTFFFAQQILEKKGLFSINNLQRKGFSEITVLKEDWCNGV